MEEAANTNGAIFVISAAQTSAGLSVTVAHQIPVTLAQQLLGAGIGADRLGAVVLACNRARNTPKLQKGTAHHWGSLNPRRAHRTWSAENPSTAIHLRRLLWPHTNATLLGAMPSLSTTNCRNALLAAPPTGGAVSLITTASSLSSTTSLRRLFGWIHGAMLSLVVIHPIPLPAEDSNDMPQH
jgi:hypothetical protein